MCQQRLWKARAVDIERRQVCLLTAVCVRDGDPADDSAPTRGRPFTETIRSNFRYRLGTNSLLYILLLSSHEFASCSPTQPRNADADIDNNGGYICGYLLQLAIKSKGAS